MCCLLWSLNHHLHCPFVKKKRNNNKKITIHCPPYVHSHVLFLDVTFPPSCPHLASLPGPDWMQYVYILRRLHVSSWLFSPTEAVDLILSLHLCRFKSRQLPLMCTCSNLFCIWFIFSCFWFCYKCCLSYFMNQPVGVIPVVDSVWTTASLFLQIEQY